MIAAARHSIYIENQYFTAEKVGDALAARLREPEGPEVVLVLRELSHGWLEEVTMQTLRTRLIERLRAADVHGRLRVYYPFVEGLTSGTCIDVHSKMIVIDDEIVRVGSANLANRSMGLDTECDLTIEARGREDVRAAICDLRAELLGEHLGFDCARVRETIERTGSLRSAIDLLQRNDRTLKPVPEAPQVSPAMLSVVSVADPGEAGRTERPGEAAELRRRDRHRRRALAGVGQDRRVRARVPGADRIVEVHAARDVPRQQSRHRLGAPRRRRVVDADRRHPLVHASRVHALPASVAHACLQ